ncbi:hypothetical protein OHW85_23110, partial [Acinetobacter baumannii]|nr:hypothetical protein [Acinetobacter baumannii]
METTEDLKINSAILYPDLMSEASDHHDLSSFKYEPNFKLPVSLIHVTHNCSLVEHKFWLCLLSHACEILENLQKNSLSASQVTNFKIPLEVVLFKTNSQHRLKEVHNILGRLRDAE